MKNKLALLIALLLLSAGCTDASTKPPAAANPPASTAPGASNAGTAALEPPAGAAEEPIVTKQQIESVPMNSTFDEVAKKIGLGKLVKKNENQAIYQYKGKNGGTAQLTFWQGKLNSVGFSDFKD